MNRQLTLLPGLVAKIVNVDVTCGSLLVEEGGGQTQYLTLGTLACCENLLMNKW